MHVIFGTGPLGQAVAVALRARGIESRLVNRSGSRPAHLDRFEVVSGDLTVSSSARRAAQGASVVYHCAAPPYPEWARTLPAMMAGAIDAASSAGARLVYGDNLYAYAPTDQPLTEDLPEQPQTRKGRVRKEVADALRAAHKEGRIQAVIGRGSDFYGPNVHISAAGDEVFGRLANGKSPRVLGDPDQLHSFTFIEDFGRALVVLANQEDSFGETWHVPNAPPVATREFAAKAAQAMGRDPKVKTTPSWLLKAFGVFNPMMKEVAEMLYQWEQPFVVDHSKFKRAFGSAFGAATPLTDGISRTAIALKRGSRPAV
ncbi:MAG: SDR family oxidoreductase [Edaphobacter sp.]